MRWPSAVLARWPPAVLARWPPAHRITALSVPRRHCSALSPRVRAQREEQALAALHATPGLDPALATVAGVVVNPTGDVACQLEFFSAACPQRSAIEEAARSAIMECGWATDCSVSAHVRQPTSFLGAKSPASLQHVGALLGVSSCKGGVGKSTIAANVAFALAELGARVGLLDADVHGPSLPSLVALPDDTLPLLQRADNRLLRPPLVHGVKLMSYGFIAKGASTGRVPAAVMRGPMVGKVVGQMLSGTEWGELDYLLVDLPPGTGDVQLTLCQSFGLTAALVITTPQKLARVDVEKGVDMFRELGVPIVSLVENMAYFKDTHGHTHYPFGTTQLEAVREYARVQADDAFRLPLEPDVSAACDDAAPLVLSRRHSAAAGQLRAVAERLTFSLARLQRPGGGVPPQLLFDPKRGLVMRVLAGVDEGCEFVLPRAALALLPGAPEGADGAVVADGAGGASVAPKGYAIGADVTGDPAVIVRWEGGKESVVTVADFKRRAVQHEP